MPNLSIKDVPEELAAAAPIPPLQGWRRGTRTIEEIAEEMFAKYPEPIRGGPLGVDIIREDRDSR